MKQNLIKISVRFISFIINLPFFYRSCKVLIQSLRSTKIKQGLKEVRKLQQEGITGDGSKYLNFLIWLPANSLRIVKLGLDRMPSCRILDLGSGPGYFIAMVNAMGHKAYGIDLGRHKIYTPINIAFDNDITFHTIVPAHPYPHKNLQAPFDIITGFSVTFDRHGRDASSSRWTPEDWILFFSNLRPLVHQNSIIVLYLNTHTILGCRGGEFKLFRAGLLRNAGFECKHVGYRTVIVCPLK